MTFTLRHEIHLHQYFSIMPNSTTEKQLTYDELRELLAQQQREIEELKAKTTKTPKGETIYDLIDTHLKVTDMEPDVHLWVDLICLFAQTVQTQTNYKPNLKRYAEYKIENLPDLLRVFGYLKNNKIFGATKNKSKMKYAYKGFEDLDANTYILYALQDEEQPVEEVLPEEDF
jgi:hypothetical protein